MDGWQLELRGDAVKAAGPTKSVWTMICGVLLFLSVSVGFYVQTASSSTSQPAPYDLHFALGLKFPRKLGVPAMLWGLFLFGYGFSGIGAVYIERVSDFLLVSAYLVASMLFFAAVVASDPQRNLRIIWWGYTLAAVFAAAIGVFAYFGLVPNSEAFLLYSRVKSTFNDPNVFGPFLVAPTLFLILRLSMSSDRRDLLLIPLVGILFLGILLSFSRGAWGNLIASGGLFLLLTWMTATSARQVARLTLAVSLIIALGVCVVAWALTSDVVSELFEQRFSLTQSYDVSEDSGRFAIQGQAVQVVLTNPLGIGPSQWAKIAGFDPHNVYLNVFLAGGWLSGFAFIALYLLTLTAGIRACFVATPFQGLQIVAVAAFAGHVGEAFIIDIDNWRHVYLLIGLVWGGIVHAQYQVEQARKEKPAANASRIGMIPIRDGFVV
jgi:O-antigen ligase